MGHVVLFVCAIQSDVAAMQEKGRVLLAYPLERRLPAIHEARSLFSDMSIGNLHNPNDFSLLPLPVRHPKGGRMNAVHLRR
jgi:hypothetical protein